MPVTLRHAYTIDDYEDIGECWHCRGRGEVLRPEMRKLSLRQYGAMIAYQQARFRAHMDIGPHLQRIAARDSRNLRIMLGIEEFK